MRRDIAIAAVADLCAKGAGFRTDVAALAASVATPNKALLIEALLECGVIPESFDHDSTEEKLYAKYCDVLLAKAFDVFGLKSVVIEERADSADVAGVSDGYSIVGDAKAFRLSRTAKNQKDFKVIALSGWRATRDYACLVCPLYQYPNTRSQIYDQATAHNVTLLGYVHLAFLVQHSIEGTTKLEAVWNLGKSIARTNNASVYWSAVDQAVCDAVRKSSGDLSAFKQRESEVLESIKAVELTHLQGEIERISNLTKEEAIQMLITETNIPSRIRQIQNVTY